MPSLGRWRRHRRSVPLAIDALRIDEGAAASSVLEDIAEVVADDLLRHLLILLLASGQGIVVVHVGVDGTPIVWEGIAKHLALAKPVAVPVADRNLVEAIVGLVATGVLNRWHHVLGSFQVLLILGLEIEFQEELGGWGDDALLEVDLRLREVQAVCHEYFGCLGEIYQEVVILGHESCFLQGLQA